MGSATIWMISCAALVASILLVLASRVWHRRRAQRDGMLSIAMVAAGISHDTNNLLMCIGAYVERLREPAPPQLQVELAEKVEELCRAAIRINRQTIRLAEQPLGAEQCTDAIGQLRGTLGLLKAAGGATANVDLDACGERVDLPLVRSQLDQILINLVVNARDAKAREVDITARVVPYLHRDTDEAILVIDVRDDGRGMSRASCRRVTRLFHGGDRPTGSGLGLPTASRLARLTGGRLDIDSLPGRGTTVTVTLPGRRVRERHGQQEAA